MKVETRCSECGRSVPDGARFCGRCGAGLAPSSRAGPGRPPAVITIAAVAAALAVIAGLGMAARTAIEAHPNRAGSPSTDPSLDPLFRDAPEARGLVPGTVLWRHDIDPGSPVVADVGAIYISVDGGIEAIDRLTGAPRWRAAGAAGGVQAGLPTVLPVVDASGTVRALDPRDGSLRWQRSGARTAGSAVLRVGPLVVVVGEGSIWGADASGRAFWDVAAADARWVGTGGSGSGIGLVFLTTTGSLRALHPLTGAVAWETPVDRPAGGIRVAGRTVVVPTAAGQLLGLDARTGEQRWSTAGGTLLGVTAEGTIVVVASERGPSVELLEASTGDRLGTTDVAEPAIGFVPSDRGLLVLGRETVTALNSVGERAWQLDVPDGPRDVVRTGSQLAIVTEDEIVALVGPD